MFFNTKWSTKFVFLKDLFILSIFDIKFDFQSRILALSFISRFKKEILENVASLPKILLFRTQRLWKSTTELILRNKLYPSHYYFLRPLYPSLTALLLKEEFLLQAKIDGLRENLGWRNVSIKEHFLLTSINRGKSLSEVLLFEEYGEDMLCTEIVLNVKNNFCTQHVLPMFWAWNFPVLNL